MENALDYCLIDFVYNDNPNVLEPPTDFQEWCADPRVQHNYNFFSQQMLEAPKSETRILSNFDNCTRSVINMTSYNYLGLATHPEVVAAAKEALDTYGLSSSGSPALSGTLDLHVKFAQKIAQFEHKEDCVIYSSGLGGNIGAIQAIMQKGDTLILDEKSHRSLVDGGVLAGAKILFFDHNNMDSLEAMLKKAKGGRLLVAVEGVYSMDGDLVDLPRVSEVCAQYNAPIYLDEAHSSLIFGENGVGVAEHFGLMDKIGMSFGTLSKAFGGVGGFVCSNERIIRYIRGYSSPWNFSCAPSPVVIGGLSKAFDVATRDSTLRDALWHNTRYLKENLQKLKLDIGKSESQVIPIIIGPSGKQLFYLAEEMQRRGLFLQPVDFPAVPAHERRFRISTSAQFTIEHMDNALNIIEDVIVKDLRQKGQLKS